MNGEIAVRQPEAVARPVSVQEVLDQVKLVHQVMRDVMRDGEHYGIIPGTKKRTLYQAGAEKLGFCFRLVPRYAGDDAPRDLGNGHREFIVRCDLYHRDTGAFVGSASGSCSTMESKYRYRTGEVIPTGLAVPREYWDQRESNPQAALASIGGPGHAVKKIDGKWEVVQKGEPIENPDIADTYNTCLKIASKRAYISTVRGATAASDIFMDPSEIDEDAGPDGPQLKKPQRKTAAPAPAQSPDPPPPDDAPPPAEDPFPPLPNEAPASNGHAETLISENQQKRLYAIARGAGCSNETIKAELLRMGYHSSKEIKRGSYDTVVEFFESLKKA